MPDPRGLLERLADRAAVAWHGGVRVRVLAGGEVLVFGRTPGPPPDRIRREVMDLAPERPGTIDLTHDGRGRWWIRCAGELADPRLEQRLRNVLGNR